MAPSKEDRIDKLEDDRNEKMYDQINQIHKILVGNGSDGLVQKVAKNGANIKQLLWLSALLVGCIVKLFFSNIDASSEIKKIKASPEHYKPSTTNLFLK